MRFIPLLLIAVALATSGCFGNDDGEGDDPPTVTTPAGNTTTTPTGSTPTTPTANTTPTTPAKPAPKELCTVSKDFQTQQPDPTTQTAVSTADCGTVAAGYTKLTLNVNFTVAEPLMVTNGVWVDLVDASGAAVATCAGPSAPGPAAPSSCTMDATNPTGAYTLAYRGIGNIDAAGNVMAS